MNLLENPTECGPGQTLSEFVNESLPMKTKVQLFFPNISQHIMLSRPVWAKRNACRLKVLN